MRSRHGRDFEARVFFPPLPCIRMLARLGSFSRAVAPIGRRAASNASKPSFPASVLNAPATEVTTLPNGVRVASEVRRSRPVRDSCQPGLSTQAVKRHAASESFTLSTLYAAGCPGR